MDLPNFDIELSLKKPVIGIDEVGRGTLAGPVVSCACIFLDYQISRSYLSKINDSKKLPEKKRIEAFDIINELKKKKKFKYAIGYATVKEIDKYNILEATKISMIRAINKLNYNKASLIIDGNLKLNLSKFNSYSFIKGDQKSYTIASASLVAKIHRDRYMRILSLNYPHYKWKQNVGYGTKQHIKEIYRSGITEHHRKSFKPIKSLIHN